jgi:hypothetical protein
MREGLLRKVPPSYSHPNLFEQKVFKGDIFIAFSGWRAYRKRCKLQAIWWHTIRRDG